MPYTQVTTNVYQIGGENISNSGDAGVFLIKCKDDSIVLIDCGIDSYEVLIRNIEETGLDPNQLVGLVLTHAHVDHTGSAADFKKNFPELRIYAHDWEREVIEGRPGTEKITAASWYGITYKPVKVDVAVKKIEENMVIGGTMFNFIHTPGHTPGSIAVLIQDEGKKVLFGQDIHGPFMQEFNSNIHDWISSMKLLLSKKADILCEGHFGIYQPATKVEKYIRNQIIQNYRI
ncbi:MAG: MBL fold metallo-hydrolase [Candidatus Lokiarchaeota archaeon]|nr:MBL fold metallo-hydrolase [Candidatus Lokiarchaeota archaeon]